MCKFLHGWLHLKGLYCVDMLGVLGDLQFAMLDFKLAFILSVKVSDKCRPTVLIHANVIQA